MSQSQGSRGESLSHLEMSVKSTTPETTKDITEAEDSPLPPASDDKNVTDNVSGATDEPKKKKRKFPPKLSMAALKFREGHDTLLIVVGICAAIVLGVIPPLNMVVLGSSIATAGDARNSNSDLNRMVVNFVILAAAGFVVAGVAAFCLESASERQVRQLKYRFLKSVLSQDIGYWDVHDTGVLAADIEQSCVMMRDGTGWKLGQVFQFSTQFIAGYVVALIRGWRMGLVLLVVTPLLATGSAIIISRVRTAARRAKLSFEQAGAVAEEALPCMRSVAAFGLENVFAERFDKRINEGLREDVKAARAKAISIGFMFCILCLSYALGWWYAGREVKRAWEKSDGDDLAVGGRVITVFFSIIIASFSLGQIVPNMNSFVTASQAVESAQKLVEHQSQIDPNDLSGTPIQQSQGKIEFKHVRFAYPTRTDRPVYENVSFTINAGETVALVGPSGCGKSTVVSLLQRFYDPQAGQILVDGVDIRNYQLKSFRDQMALVSQEPRLFCDTVARNIEYGREAKSTLPEIQAAAKMANAHDFIKMFPKGYQTNVGQGGSMLSGGQKQRVAIARAILRDPNILLLDEATSALDNQSEKIVQRALDQLIAQRRRTTIIIAHRLSTIRFADKIIVMDNPDGYGSRVIEQGTHEELMKKANGVYQGLVHAQELISTAAADEESSEVAEAVTAAYENKQVALRISKEFVESKHSRLSNTLARDVSIARMLSKYSKEEGSIVREESKLSRDPSKDESKKPGKPEGVWISHTDGKKPRVREILKYTREDWWVLLIGVISSVFVGGIFPTIGVLIAQFTGTFYTYDPALSATENGDIVSDKTRKLALFFVGFAVLVFIVQIGQEFSFGYAGERLIARIRRVLFKHILHQDMEFFDAPQNTTGTLIAIISADCALLKGVVGGNMSIVFQNTATLLYAIVTGFVTNPKLAGVAIVGFFMNFPTGFLQNRLVRTTQVRPDALEDQQSAGFVMNEAVQGLKVVASYGLQQQMLEAYDKVLKEELHNGQRNAFVSGAAAGIGNSIAYLCNALSFWYGGRLLHESLATGSGDLTMTGMTRVIFVFMMASNSIGRSVSWVTDRKKAKLATVNILGVINRRPKVDVQDPAGTTRAIEGNINFDHIKFRYTHRPEVQVLADVDFSIEKGQTVALVGASGSGKSTIVQLLERFYDVEASDVMRIWLQHQNDNLEDIEKRMSLSEMFGGVVKLDGTPIQDYNLVSLRKQLGLVSQEPILFQGSVRENIHFGNPDATEDDVIEAAKLANAHDFIMNQPEGYETEVGKGGGHLSGGQKQRIAIARALVRKPKLLILDEATSALDPESEEVVQRALDGLMAKSDCTTIVIAHRLSTVRNADKIVVFAPEPNLGSHIAEIGTHDELMARPDGIYHTLVMISQNVEKA
eukprot:Gregarina_sp_Pseudo_9__5994@NODE_98_length_4303_cov_12_883443_g90_i0_p1_GENE_NODE_98_length_4303_cov_12_883443_g90_i0NODE_98_length_4303_cov_12_883443_g90_i0_p1_ORF_typecomplete_len1396_score327_08ABC_membrane/PF00664_23/1_9e45ABC_membrane/PF00664_23/2_2e47ABC_tran/PF00005_27/7e44ABC_tran/PF00005_27/42ABC_tran/PF00005_27/2e38SMC_N/PF02463_19/14SMC_N/PF02463_19/1_4e05SMC_N/PF02463_19/57SMC_N/PF02463_19/1_1e05AAA_21/PF13304_6/0_0012AAA_21/PF13304_6/1_3e05AAA_22/PF13401_6/0_00046AAA_22/PF13401_6/0_